MNQLMNNNLIHFNERKRIYFDRAEQKETKIRLQYELSRVETIHQWFIICCDENQFNYHCERTVFFKKWA